MGASNRTPKRMKSDHWRREPPRNPRAQTDVRAISYAGPLSQKAANSKTNERSRFTRRSRAGRRKDSCSVLLNQTNSELTFVQRCVLLPTLLRAVLTFRGRVRAIGGHQQAVDRILNVFSQRFHIAGGVRNDDHAGVAASRPRRVVAICRRSSRRGRSRVVGIAGPENSCRIIVSRFAVNRGNRVLNTRGRRGGRHVIVDGRRIPPYETGAALTAVMCAVELPL